MNAEKQPSEIASGQRTKPRRAIEPEARITVEYVVSQDEFGYHATAFILGQQPRKVGPVTDTSGELAISRLEPDLNQRIQERWPIGFTPKA